MQLDLSKLEIGKTCNNSINISCILIGRRWRILKEDNMLLKTL